MSPEIPQFQQSSMVMPMWLFREQQGYKLVVLNWWSFCSLGTFGSFERHISCYDWGMCGGRGVTGVQLVDRGWGTLQHLLHCAEQPLSKEFSGQYC